MDVQGDNVKRIVGRAANEWLWSAQWSPDGQRLAYIRAQHLPDKYFQFIETCDLKGADRKEVVVVSGSDPWVRDMTWLSDGRIIIHGSKRMARVTPISGKSMLIRSEERQQTNQNASRNGPDLISHG